MKQTLIKIIDDHYVVVDDSEIKVGDWYIRTDTNIMFSTLKGSNPDIIERYCKKITHSTQPLELLSENGLSGMGFSKVRPLNVFEVKELIGEVDVEKKANGCIAKVKHNGSFIRGYTQALEDNKDKKYTEEDLLLFSAELIGKFKLGIIKEVEDVNTIIQSLQPKTEWEVTFDEQGKLKLV